MTHLAEEQLTSAYYGNTDAETRAHLDGCTKCRSNFERLKEMLDAIREYPVPERPASYGNDVWIRLLPQLSIRKPRQSWFRWWVPIPAGIALAAVAFVAGILTQQHRQLGVIPETARERVLLMAMSDHLERSQIVLAELLNSTPEGMDFNEERRRARDLLTENRLLRQAAVRSGDASDAAVLDDLERALLNIANSPSSASSTDIEALQRRVENDGLLFKVRIVSTDARQKGQQL